MTSRPPSPPSSDPAREGGASRHRGASDDELVQRCLEGSAGAWEEMVRRYERLVYSIPRRYGLDRQRSEDVFQEVFAILMRRLDGIRDRAALPKWLITTTHRMCRHVARRSGATGIGDPGLIEADAPPDEAALRWERQQLVRAGLRRLGGRCERLLTLLYMDPGRVSYDTVARELGMPVGGVGPTRARCLAKLTAILEEEIGPDQLL